MVDDVYKGKMLKLEVEKEYMIERFDKKSIQIFIKILDPTYSLIRIKYNDESFTKDVAPINIYFAVEIIKLSDLFLKYIVLLTQQAHLCLQEKMASGQN